MDTENHAKMSQKDSLVMPLSLSVQPIRIIFASLIDFALIFIFHISYLFQKWAVEITLLIAALIVLKDVGRDGAMEIVIGHRGHVLIKVLLDIYLNLAKKDLYRSSQSCMSQKYIDLLALCLIIKL